MTLLTSHVDDCKLSGIAADAKSTRLESRVKTRCGAPPEAFIVTLDTYANVFWSQPLTLLLPFEEWRWLRLINKPLASL